MDESSEILHELPKKDFNWSSKNLELKMLSCKFLSFKCLQLVSLFYGDEYLKKTKNVGYTWINWTGGDIYIDR